MDTELLSAIRAILNEELKPIKTEIEGIKTEMTGMKNQIDETYEIVKALVEASEVNKAEHDAMMNDIAHIKGNVEKIKIDMYRVEEITANNWAEMTRMKQAR
jgi:septation ring formation regulator EzrA